jgi:hypothetical protein
MTDPETPDDGKRPEAPSGPAQPAEAKPAAPKAGVPGPGPARPEPAKATVIRPDAGRTAPPPSPALPPDTKPLSQRGPRVVLTALGFVLAFAGIAYVWYELQALPRPDGVMAARVASLEGEMRALLQRVDALEKRPAPDVKPLEARVAALERRPAGAAAPAAVDLAPLEARIAALEKQPAAAADLGPIEAKVAAAEEASRRALALQGAAAALDAGRPLGTIAGAPPALARFATTAPPTLASLRLEFDEAAAAARAASVPAEPEGFAARVWQRVAGLVTVRRGPEVLVGSPAAYTLGVARQRLDIGDLPGTLAALDRLDPAAGAAMKPWRDKAQALLDARAALVAG